MKFYLMTVFVKEQHGPIHLGKITYIEILQNQTKQISFNKNKLLFNNSNKLYIKKNNII